MSTDVDDLAGLEGPAPIPEVEQDGSVWAVARAAHADLARKHEERKPLELDVTGDGGETGIVIRFKFVELGATEKSTKGLQAMRALTDQALYSAIDTLILACDEILVRLPKGERENGTFGSGLRPLGEPGRPVRFDYQLCDGMGWERMKARDIVVKLFDGEEGKYAILDMAQEVSAWIKSTGDEASTDFARG